MVKKPASAPPEREEDQDAATRYILAILARYDDQHEYVD